MALSAAKRTTTVILDAEMTRLLDLASKERGVSRSEFIRAQLRRALEQYKTHPKPRSAGAMRHARAPRDEEKESTTSFAMIAKRCERSSMTWSVEPSSTLRRPTDS